GPLSALRPAAAAADGSGALGASVLGLLSPIFWALALTATVKYAFFVTRADNRGGGGTPSLMVLARRTFERAPLAITGLGVLGASLFFGDAMLTPAISVLSAVVGLVLVAPRLQSWVIPFTSELIALLF